MQPPDSTLPHFPTSGCYFPRSPPTHTPNPRQPLVYRRQPCSSAWSECTQLALPSHSMHTEQGVLQAAKQSQQVKHSKSDRIMSTSQIPYLPQPAHNTI